MNLFFWRKNLTIDTFASGLADEFYSQIQPEMAEQFFQGVISKENKVKKDVKLRANVENSFSKAIEQIDYFRQIHSLGVYGKARLHLSFMERLKTLGYADELAKRVNEFLMLKTP